MNSKLRRASSVLSFQNMKKESTNIKHAKSELNLVALSTLGGIDENTNENMAEEGDNGTDTVTGKTNEVMIGENLMWATSRLHCPHVNNEQTMHHSISNENLQGLSEIKQSSMKRSKSALTLSMYELNRTENDNLNRMRESMSEKRKNRQKKSVRFSTVEIRKFPLLLGDNPAVSKGPAITIDWTPVSKTITPLDKFQDKCISPKEKNSCREQNLRIHAFERRLMLLDAGYSLREITRGIQEVNMIKEQRKSTLNRLQFAMIEEMAEKINNRFKKMRFGKQKANFSSDDHAFLATTQNQ